MDLKLVKYTLPVPSVVMPRGIPIAAVAAGTGVVPIGGMPATVEIRNLGTCAHRIPAAPRYRAMRTVFMAVLLGILCDAWQVRAPAGALLRCRYQPRRCC